MHHARMIFEDTPAFIAVPNVLRHRKTEIIFLSLDDEDDNRNGISACNLFFQAVLSAIALTSAVFYLTDPLFPMYNFSLHLNLCIYGI